MRGKRAKKRPIEVDPIYKSKIVTRMINVVMQGGKKTIAQDIVYTAMGNLAEDRKEAAKMFEDAVKNVMPAQEVRSRRVGGATYQVPIPLRHDRAEALAIRWIVGAVRKKKGKPTSDRLFEELKSAHEGIGDAMRKREETHRMAEANRAFAHFARY